MLSVLRGKLRRKQRRKQRRRTTPRTRRQKRTRMMRRRPRRRTRASHLTMMTMEKLKILGMRYALLESGFIQSIQRHKSKSWAPKTLKERLYRWINPPQLALQAEQLQPKEEIMISCSPSFFLYSNLQYCNFVLRCVKLKTDATRLRGCKGLCSDLIELLGFFCLVDLDLALV